MKRNRSTRLAATVLAAFLAAAYANAWAQTSSTRAPNLNERLSDYLLSIKPAEERYLFAAEWITPESRKLQAERHSSLKAMLGNARDAGGVSTLDAQERARWLSLLERESPRGRVALPSVDARWLGANPAKDPLLAPNHELRIPMRPHTVTVVKNDGSLCAVRFEPDRAAADYGASCGELAQPTDWAYVVQPDGEIFKFGIALWNQTAQMAPAPGAWIWMPAHSRDWPDAFTQTLVAFLAAQGIHQADVSANSNDYGAAMGSAPSAGPTTSLPLGALKTSPADYRDLEVSASDWGGVGLLQTPSARFLPSGYGSLTISRTQPYTRMNVMLTPFDWLEAGFRYVNVSNRPYGEEIAGDQSYKDRSIDAKFRLVQESRYVPQIALGFRDLAGTGLFASEYLVASKRFGPLDVNLGLGWGYIGARGNVSNPLAGIFGDRMKVRPKASGSGQGGEFNTNTYFRGPAAFFGGLQYQTPWEKLTLKLELDGNDYQSEPQNNNQRASSPINVGAVWQLSRHTAVTLGYERGNTVMLGISFGTNLGEIATPKLDDPKPLAAKLERRDIAIAAMPAENWSLLIAALQEQTGWQVRQITRRDAALHVEIAMAPTFDWDNAIDRANRVMHALAPKEIASFAYTVNERGLTMTTLSVQRDAWAKQAASFVPPEQRVAAQASAVAYPTQTSAPTAAQVLAGNAHKTWAGGVNLNYSQTLGGPDAFILYQLAADAEGEWRPFENTWVTGTLRLALLDNYDKFKYTADSNLPRVRTNIREYLTSSDLTLPLLQATHTQQLTQSIYASVYGGLLERMYAGVGAELLYKPFGSSVALGLDINRVRQRGFKQDFSLRDYEVTTGHATLYWHTGWQDILAKISAGQYLAGDRGVTLDLSRVFDNGVRIGAFATKTNVSAEDFGEGSFDKGIYVSIPFDAMMTKSSKSEALLLWQPLVRDGGAKLNRRFELYDLTRLGSGK